MKVYLFNDKDNTTVTLPNRISGMYPLYFSGKTIANIFNSDSRWNIRLSSDFSSKDFISPSGGEFIPYKIYTLVSRFTKERVTILMTPSYEENTSPYNVHSNIITIGNDPLCEIRFPIELIDKTFLKMSFDGKQWIAETASPYFFINGKRAARIQKIYNGDYIFFFGLKIIVIGRRFIINNPNDIVKIKTGALTQQQTAKIPEDRSEETIFSSNQHDILPLYTDDDYFYKAPRFNFVIEEAAVQIDEPPAPERREKIPIILTLGPQLTMMATSVLSIVSLFATSSNSLSPIRIIISLSTVVIMAAGTVLWPTISRRFNAKRLQKKEKENQRKYEKYLTQKKHLLDFIKATQKQKLLEIHPDPLQCVEIAKNHSPQLWQRSVEHEDFLHIRLGLGNIKTKLNINRPEEHFSIEDDDSLLLAAKKTINDSLYIQSAPVIYDFTKEPLSVIVGEPAITKPFMDCLLTQIMTSHSYAELKIVSFVKESSQWQYLKIIPHSWDNQKTSRFFATTTEDFLTICNNLEKIFDTRLSNGDDEKLEDDGSQHNSTTDFRNYRPYYLFFIEDIDLARGVSLIKKILRYKRNMGFSIITTVKNVSILPSGASGYISILPQNSTIISNDKTTNNTVFTADLNINDYVDVYSCAQNLANIRVPIEKSKFELPKSVSFLELYKCGRVEHFNSLDRWAKNNPSLSLSVPVGIDQSGEIFRMDIHEKAFGPHGLVAGTTGSGKSEWIVTYILSLAVNFNPDEVQFVLIDYKGGGLAKSFENAELNVQLPHLAGTITNLDKSEIFRSISAIESELKRRQSIFNAAREKLRKGSMDIYEYQQCYRDHLVDEPLSHLLIICDEFAELKQQQPDFMEQLISTSRIGRSLGVHLILATQKPTGIVNEQIWSNSKFKICLKVQDESDSREILKKTDAAFLKQTGAFYLQVGNDDYYNLGQSAWTGAKYYPSDIVHREIDESVQKIDNLGQIVNSYRKQEKKHENQGEELLNIVTYLSNISKQFDFVRHQLWLKNVEPKILLSDLYKKYDKKESDKFTFNTIIGEYDEPRRQEQGLMSVDLSQGNIAIIGQANSGTENLISTIIWSSVCERTPAEIAYYIIDFGSETLKKFAKFPQVGEVVFQSETDRVMGVFNLVIEELDKRKEILSDYNGSFEYYNKTQSEKMNLMVIVINNFDIFNETLPRLNDPLTTLFRDAPKYGIVFIVSAGAPNTISRRQLQYFNHTIVMQMSDDSQYRSITDCRRGLIPKKVIGRGICKLDPSEADSYCEFQTAMIDSEEKELETIKAYADKCIDYYKCKVKQLTKIPADVTSDNLLKFVNDLSDVPIGYSLYEKNVARYDFSKQKIHLLSAKNLNDKMGSIYGLSAILSKVPNTKVRVIDMAKLFKKPILDVKLFTDDDINIVFGALEKDTLERTRAQGFAINIIIGVGHFKSTLSQGGIEIFQNIFDKLPNTEHSIYLLVDNYDNLRTLKLEKWFSQVNTSQGIWLGTEFDSQSLIEATSIRAEDTKYNFKGLAFSVNDGTYDIIKTITDSE